MEEEINAPQKQASEPVVQTAQETAVSGTEQSAPQDVAIPEHWEQPIKEFFNNELFAKDLNAKKVFYEKFKSLDDGYSTKYQDLAKQRKDYEAQFGKLKEDERFLNSYRDFEKIIAPEHLSAITAQFGGIPQYMANLHNLDRQFTQDPLGFINGLMQAQGITIDMLQKGVQSPEYQAKQSQRQQVSQLEQIKQQMAQEIEARFSKADFDRQVASFLSEKDAAGNPAHPFVDKVADTMDLILSKNPQLSLKEAYERACYAEPEIRTQLIQGQVQQSALSKNKAEELAKAKNARGIETAPKSPNAKPHKGFEETLEELLNQQPDE